MLRIVLDELVDKGGPGTIILEVLQVATSCLVEVPEQVPRVPRDHSQFICLMFHHAESFPLFKESAFLSNQQVPQRAPQLDVYIFLALLLRETERVFVELVDLCLVLDLLVEARYNSLPALDGIDAQLGAAFLEFVPFELAHVRSLHVHRYQNAL